MAVDDFAIELALLRADATRDDVRRCCRDAVASGAAAVIVHTSNLLVARGELGDAPVATIAAVDFPLGASDTDAKRYAVEVAVDHDAQGLLVVANHARLKEAAWDGYSRELRDLVEAADERPLSVLIETSLVGDDSLSRAASLAHEAQAKGITLSAMFGVRDLPVSKITALRSTLAQGVQLKTFAGSAGEAVLQPIRDAGVNRVIVKYSVGRL